MKILSTSQIREADDFTIRHEPVAGIELMERASQGLFREISQSAANYSCIRIFAGPGNNGGDGIALARMLAEAGMPSCLYLSAREGELSPDALTNFKRLPSGGSLTVEFLLDPESFPVISSGDLVVDALFGSGLTREPSGWFAELIDRINEAGATTVAIDIPSGLYGDDNRLNSLKHVVRATRTLTFELPKLAFFFRENDPFVGLWKLVPIGLHPEFIREAPSDWHLITGADAAGWLRPRPTFSHKGTYGHALLACGSTGKAGAAVLAAGACIRSGAGLTTVALPSGANPIVQSAVPEAMTLPGVHPDCLTLFPDCDPFTAVGIGPGIGTAPETREGFERFLDRCRVPLVLDADALNLLAMNPGSLLRVPKNSILTPHPGEFARLFGEDPDDFSRVLRVRELARTYGLVIVLKGARTAIASPDGSVWFNATGNPGMATGGSGDVLTGLLTGLLAQGYEPATAARLGVFVHGLAGDLAAEEEGPEGLTAGLLIRCLGKAFKGLRKQVP